MKRIEKLRMTFPSTEAVKTEYKCPECRDTQLIDAGEGRVKPCKCYIKEMAERLWSNFGVNPNDVRKINEYKPYDEQTTAARDKAVNYIKRFDAIRRLRENSYGLFGEPGAGKSHLVIAIGAALLNRDKPVSAIYMPYIEVMRELKANSMDDEYYIKIQSRYQMAELLIIDDLFKDKLKDGKPIMDRYGNVIGLNEADMRAIYPILNYRYLNFMPTVISTECTPNILLKFDKALAGRIIEPCGDNLTVFVGEQYNYRMRRFVK